MKLVDSFRALHPDEKQVGTFNGFRDETNPDKIDYVFVAPDAKVERAMIHRDRFNGIWPSDHLPVSATISWSGR